MECKWKRNRVTRNPSNPALQQLWIYEDGITINSFTAQFSCSFIIYSQLLLYHFFHHYHHRFPTFMNCSQNSISTFIALFYIQLQKLSSVKFEIPFSCCHILLQYCHGCHYIFVFIFGSNYEFHLFMDFIRRRTILVVGCNPGFSK